MTGKTKSALLKGTFANLGFEAQLWAAANALRGSMDAAEYKHLVLGLIFLKYISDAFEAYHAKLEDERDQGADPEDPDEYRAENIFWVPPEGRWSELQKTARQPTIGGLWTGRCQPSSATTPPSRGCFPKTTPSMRAVKSDFCSNTEPPGVADLVTSKVDVRSLKCE